MLKNKKIYDGYQIFKSEYERVCEKFIRIWRKSNGVKSLDDWWILKVKEKT